MTRQNVLRSHVNFVRLLHRCERDASILHNSKNSNESSTIDFVEFSARLESLDRALQLLMKDSAREWSLPSNANFDSDDVPTTSFAAPTRAQLATFERAVKQLREVNYNTINVVVPVVMPTTTTTTTTTSSSTTVAVAAESSSSASPRNEKKSSSESSENINARDELLGVRNRRREAQRAAVDKALSAGQLDAQLEEQEKLQAMYKRELARMAAVLKEAALQQSTVVKGGNAMIDDLNDSVAENRERIIAENKRLKEHTDKWSSGVLFYWLILVFAALVFIGMVIFMKIVPK